jgi:glycosyltransferase involved in cell wall biosynthesis
MALNRLLAVSHEGAVGGAPIVLADLGRWMRANTDIEIHTLMLGDGPMWSRFELNGEVALLDDLVAAAEAGEPPLDQLGQFDLVLLNSLGSLAALPLMPAGVPVISYIHELQVACRDWTSLHGRAPLSEGPDAWIAASRPVGEMLVGEFGVSPERLSVNPSFIDVPRLLERRVDVRAAEHRRRSLGIPGDATIVMGSGTIEWRKGPEFFVQLACEIRRSSPDPVHFVWVGGSLEGPDWERLRSDLERTGADHVHLTGPVDDPVPLYQLADVFVLTSHEDPFPLVCLEHAALGHPVVTFRNGGIVDVLSEAGPDAALGVVDHLDTAAMAERVTALIYDQSLRRRAGEQLRDRVTTTHDLSVAAPALVEDLRRFSELERHTNGPT